MTSAPATEVRIAHRPTLAAAALGACFAACGVGPIGGGAKLSASSGAASASGGAPGSASSASGQSTDGGGASASAGAGGSEPCGSFVYSRHATCQACAETHCCHWLSACAPGSSCALFVDCVHGCVGIKTCEQLCATSNSDGAAIAENLLGCIEPAAGGGCAASCGAICDTGLEGPSVSCGACLGSSCCAEVNACLYAEGCVACLQSPTASCAQNVNAEFVRQCQASNCAAACGTGVCTSGWKTGSGGCDTCLGSNCCAEVKTCLTDAGCVDCLVASAPAASCIASAAYQAVRSCWNGVCAGAAQCDGQR